MKSLNIKSAMISGGIVWVLGVLAFVASHLFPVMPDADLQANWVLSVALIPASTLGAHIYYRKGHKTNGFLLGAMLFIVALTFDSLITVPFFIIPYGGTYVSFFSDVGFWLLGIEYISVVAAYWLIERVLSV